MNRPVGKIENRVRSLLLGNNILTQGLIMIVISIIAYYVLYLHSSSVGPYPLFFFNALNYFILFVLFLIGTVFPLTVATFFHFEDFPLAPGGRLKKASGFFLLLVISFMLSLIVCKGILFLAGLNTNKTVTGLANIVEFILMVTLVSFSGSSVFNIRKRKAFIVAIPLIFAQLFFYLAIIIVKKLFKAHVFLSELSLAENIGIVILLFIPLVILFFVQSKGGMSRLAQESKFFNDDSPKDASPEAAYRAALGFIESGRFQEALKYLDICLKDNNTIQDAYLQRAEVHLSLGHFEAAAEDAETYIDAKARGIDEKPYLILMHAYASMNEWENVYDVSGELLERFPSNIQAIYYAAYSLKEQHENEKAIEVLNGVKEIWDGLPEYLQKTEKPFYKRAVKLLDELKNQDI